MASKAARSIYRVITTIVVVAIVVVAVALVGVRLVGLNAYTVLSGSMEPTYPTGSVIWVQKVAPEEVQVGDPITFVLNEDLTVATHRVVEIDAENQQFVTKGDANENVDAAPVHFNNLIGTPVFSVPAMGYAVSFIQNPPGTYLAIAIGAVLLLLVFLPEIIGAFKDDDEPKRGSHAAGRRRG